MNHTHYDIVKQGHDAVAKWRAEHTTDMLDLSGANLTEANLTDADLAYAALTGANLYGATLTDADLAGANLYGATLTGATLTGANLMGANLTGAYLAGADLTGANMWNTVGNGREVKTVQTDLWTVTYTADVMQIGCQSYPLDAWWDFDDATISALDSKALEWWTRWKPILQQIIVTSPATPTNNKEERINAVELKR